MNYAKETLGLKAVGAIVTPDNASSIKLIEKLGMQYEGKIKYPGEEEELSLYSKSS